MRASILVSASIALAGLVGCGGGGSVDAGSDAGTACTPGLSIACAGTGGCAGFQVCNADGRGFGICACPSDAGTPDTGIPDSGPPDAGGPCDPVAQTGCGTGERCTWARATTLATGHAQCAPAGAVGVLADCTIDSTTGLDDCDVGLACNGALCVPICSLTAAAPSGYSCGAQQDFFSNVDGSGATAGMGFPLCDPVTQVRFDGAADCGSGTRRSGCTGGHGGPYTCTPAGLAANTQGVTPTLDPSGHPYINGCAPGFVALPTDSTLTTWLCTAYCTPAPTSSEAHATPQGTPPHDCAAAGASFECRYDNFLAPMATAAGNMAGVCFDYVVAGTPSCTAISSSASDTTVWGCTPTPIP